MMHVSSRKNNNNSNNNSWNSPNQEGRQPGPEVNFQERKFVTSRNYLATWIGYGTLKDKTLFSNKQKSMETAREFWPLSRHEAFVAFFLLKRDV
jgi:hypothetical protein